MPLIQVNAPTGALNKSQQDQLIKRISNALLSAEGADINDPGAQSLAWAFYTESVPGNRYVGGKNIDRPPFIISISTPQGALNSDSRSELVRAIGEIINDLVGIYEGRLNHWTMMNEIDEGSWAGAGQIFSLAAIQSAMNIQAA